MTRDDIDLHSVIPAHYAIHDRLQNWGRYVRDGQGSSGTQPMFRHYRPYLVPRDPQGEPPDSLDAMRVEREVSFLPGKHAYAVRWCYVFPWRNPHRVMRELAVQRATLCELIHDGRSMLKNRLRSIAGGLTIGEQSDPPPGDLLLLAEE